MTQTAISRVDRSAQPTPLAIQGQALSFRFESLGIRVIMIGGEPWFVAADVCKAINLTNSRMALRALDDNEKGVSSIDTPGGVQQVAIVSESGMYTLVLRCRDAVKPGSVPHKFRKWVTGKVLPSIRKSGSYSDPLKIKRAHAMAAQVAASASHAVFDKVLSGNEDQMFGRWVFNLSADRDGQPTIAHVKPIEREAFISSLPRLAKMIANSEYPCSTDDLLRLSSACFEQLKRKLKASTKEVRP